MARAIILGISLAFMIFGHAPMWAWGIYGLVCVTSEERE